MTSPLCTVFNFKKLMDKTLLKRLEKENIEIIDFDGVQEILANYMIYDHNEIIIDIIKEIKER